MINDKKMFDIDYNYLNILSKRNNYLINSLIRRCHVMA